MPQIKQLFFDCDNTLVLSEDVAFEACADLANEILAEHGISDRYSGEQLIAEFIGQTFRGMMTALQEKYGFEMSASKINHYVREEENIVMSNLQEKGRPCEGSMEVLQKLFNEKKYGLAVVSSSALRRIRASLEKTGQDNYFPHQHIFSAATSLEKPASKPDPAIYLHALKTIDVQPDQCVAVEDSQSGARAALRAGIACIAYVGAYHTVERQSQVAQTLTDLGCKAVMYKWSEFFDCLQKIVQS